MAIDWQKPVQVSIEGTWCDAQDVCSAHLVLVGGRRFVVADLWETTECGRAVRNSARVDWSLPVYAIVDGRRRTLSWCMKLPNCDRAFAVDGCSYAYLVSTTDLELTNDIDE